MSFVVLTMLLDAKLGTPNQLPLPTWSGPDPSVVRVQSILFSSLSSALLAAFIAMLGKQWLNLHVDGSFIDRNRHRELKMRGMITWRFKFVMECLPLIMQVSLYLLGYALAWYLWDISHTVSAVIITFTVFGVVFYLFIVFAGTFSKTCPFQTPVSIILRATLEYYREDIAKASKAARNFFGFTQSRAILITHHRQTTTPPPIASDTDDQDSEVRAELGCILTMFRMTKAPDSVTATMAYIPEIIWDDRVKSVPLLRVYQTLRESLLCSADGKIFPRQGARDQAFWSAKALVHLYTQRRYICGVDTTLSNQVKLINHTSQPLGQGHRGSDRDFDLESTFYIVDWTFDIPAEITWSELQLSESHHYWLSHILQYRAWDALDKGGALTEDVRGFVRESLSRGSPTRVVADCLFIVYMVAGHKPRPRALLIKDRRLAFFNTLYTNADETRSYEITEIIDKTFDNLDQVFGQDNPGDISSAVEALSLAVLLRDHRICTRSYALFRIIMDRANKDDTLWESASLSMQGAYTSSASNVPRVGDPRQVLEFLHHHMSLQQRGNARDKPIHHVFSALALASNEETHRGLAATRDFPNPLFISTIIEALENMEFKALRKSTIFMLSELDDQLFTTDKAFADPERAKDFVLAWSTAIHEFLGDPTHMVEKVVVKVLLAIANLPRLRVHLPKERWGLIQHFPYVTNGNPPPLQRCLKDASIFPFFKQTLNTRSSSPWLRMMWVLYYLLSKEVQKQLEEATREIASGHDAFLLDSYVSLFDGYLKTLQTQVDALEPLSQAAAELRMKYELTAKAKERLVSVRKGKEENIRY